MRLKTSRGPNRRRCEPVKLGHANRLRLMRLYAADFGDRDEQLRFAARYLPQLADWLGERAARVQSRTGGAPARG
jgi:hypothetical protein